MKGPVLAGGICSLLFPLTKVTNKLLVPVYDRPMIYHSTPTMVNAGIRKILLVTGGKNAGESLWFWGTVAASV
jgi:glucose-1-phosphate thymidylyltransferase